MKFQVKKAMPLVSNQKHGFDFVFLEYELKNLPISNHD